MMVKPTKNKISIPTVTPKEEMKLLVGRPTDYKKDFCEMVVDHMAKGFSLQSFAGVVGVTRQCLYDWMDANNDFKKACEVGRERSRLFWENIMLENLVFSRMGKQIDFRMWQFNMMNRFREDWTEKPDQNGNTFQIGEVTITEVRANFGTPTPLTPSEGEVLKTIDIPD